MVLRGGAKAVGAVVQLTEAAAAAPGGDQGQNPRVWMGEMREDLSRENMELRKFFGAEQEEGRGRDS